jgi:hypothetical protein
MNRNDDTSDTAATLPGELTEQELDVVVGGASPQLLTSLLSANAARFQPPAIIRFLPPNPC